MKITHRISTGQFEYVEIEHEARESTADFVGKEIKEDHDALKAAFAPKPTNAGVPDREYNSFIDNMLLGGDNHISTWENLSDKQRDSAQVIKRALKRISAKENKQPE